MNSFMTIFKKEIIELYRTKKILILIIIFLFIAVGSPILAKLLPDLIKNFPSDQIQLKIPEPTWRDSIDQFVKNLNQLAMIVIIFMFAGSICEEKNRKTLELVLAKPVSRGGFILAKFLSSFFVSKIIFIFSTCIFIFYTYSIFESFPYFNFCVLVLGSLIFLLFNISLSLLFSTILNNQIAVAGVAFFIDIIISTLLGNINWLQRYLPTFVFANYHELMAGKAFIDFLPSFITTLILIIVMISVAIFSFNKQEIER